MNDKFILLTTTDNNPVIIGLSNIASIEPHDSDLKKNAATRLTLNFARNKDLWPKTIDVTESFEQIKSMLGL